MDQGLTRLIVTIILPPLQGLADLFSLLTLGLSTTLLLQLNTITGGAYSSKQHGNQASFGQKLNYSGIIPVISGFSHYACCANLPK